MTNVIHFPNPLAKAIAAVEHGMYWAIQAYAADRYQRLGEAEPYRLLRLLEADPDGVVANHEFTGQGRG